MMKLTSTKFIFTLLISIFILFGQTAWAKNYYVNQKFSSSPTGILGETWDNPYLELQDALTNPSLIAGDQIWVVGSGVFPIEYKPTTVTDRTASFVLKNGVKLYGGFPDLLTAANDGDFTLRDAATHTTILSGDIGAGFLDSYHVLTVNGGVSSTLVDGFTIQNGYADALAFPDNSGAALYDTGGDVTFNDCIFQNNTASSSGSGGAIYSEGTLNLTNCKFDNNNADDAGGAIFFAAGANNTLILNCQFSANSANSGGGAIYYYNNTNHKIINSLFYGSNSTNSTIGGGAIFVNKNAAITLTNSTLTNNHAASSTTGAGGLHIANSGTATIQNSIFWGNTSLNNSSEIKQVSTVTGAAITIDNTIIEGFGSTYTNGVGNISADPLFVNPGSPPEDYSLQSTSPAIDKGNDSFIFELTDIRGYPRKSSSSTPYKVDMGAYEFVDSLTVINTNKNGFGSLRQALSNAMNIGDIVKFNIPSAGVHVIRPSPSLRFQSASSGITIDGYTQPNTAQATSTTPATILISIVGDLLAESNTLTMNIPNCTIKGLNIYGNVNGSINAEVNITANGNTVEGCYIGTLADGISMPSNFTRTHGILISGAAQNITIGGDISINPEKKNVIGFCGASGLVYKAVWGSTPPVPDQNILIKGNNIGLGVDNSTNIGNSRNGITLNTDYTGIEISENSIANNRGLGIDLNNDGKTTNDTNDIDEGANRGQNTPIITAITNGGTGMINITYNVPSLSPNSNYGTSGILVEFFITDDHGQGQIFLGNDFYTTTNFMAGNKTISLALTTSFTKKIVATATDFDGNTSEFSDRLPLNLLVNDILTGNNDGSTWQNAFHDLQDALAVFQEGDTIWVAEGEYYPTNGTNRNISFNLSQGMKLYGGFPDGLTGVGNFSDKNGSPTILSGNIGIQGDSTDNSYHVLNANSISNIILDGFIIEKGQADGGGTNQNIGGAFIVEVSNSLAISNCIFRNNLALARGGAVYLGSDSDMNFTDCTFENNISTNQGGAIYNDGYMIVNSLSFNNNTSNNLGGAIYNNIILEIYDATFSNNATSTANSKGGAIYNASGLKVYRSTFKNNILTAASTEGGAVYDATGAIIDDCLFQNNSSSYTGGALRSAGNLTLTSSTFTGNNTACGGGIYIAGISRDNATIDRCILKENGGSNGAIYVDGQITANITNSLFDKNKALGASAIIAWNQSITNITNCTFVNQIGSASSVLRANGDNSNPTPFSTINIYNSIFWNNTNTSVSQNNSNGNPSSVTINYSLVPEIDASTWTGVTVVGANMTYNTDPLFANQGAKDYRLKSIASSPSIDAGDNSVISSALDLNGKPRNKDIVGVIDTGANPPYIVDLGAYEAQDQIPILGIAKQVGNVLQTGFATFDVSYTITVQNYGSVALSNVQVTDDLASSFAGATSFMLSGAVAATGTLSPNSSFDGKTDINLLTLSTLAIGTASIINFTVHVDLNGSTTSIFNNFAIATGSSPNGTGTNDISTNGTDPDPNGNNNPDEQIPTPVTLENPVLGLAKEVLSKTNLGAGQFDVAYRIHLENLGNIDLQSIQVEDNLFNTFTGATVVGIQSLSVSTASLEFNTTFDGILSTGILERELSTLPFGQTAFIDFTVRVDIGNVSQATFTNFAIGTGSSPNGAGTNDISTRGDNPDPNNDGNPSEDRLTPLILINRINSPFNLEASSRAAGRVELTWQESSNNELGFRIERSQDGGITYLVLDSVRIDEIFFLDSLAIPTVKYTYRVQAYNANLNSTYSNQAEVVANVFDEIASNLPNISNRKVAWGDYDNDNDLDILIIGETTTQIFTNNGNDNFTNSGITNLPILKNADAIWKDFDQDGDLDILMTGLSQTNVPQTFIYRNLGSSFEQIANDLTGVHLSAVASADFDNDGNNDIIITGATDFAATNPVSRIYFNLGNGEFDTTFVELQGVMRSAVAVADIDNNGFIDIVISGETASGVLTTIYDNQDSVFVSKTSSLPNLKNASLAFADYDNDNDFDILIAGQQANGDALSQIYENQNGTAWNLKRTLAGVQNGSANWADFNNDGFADVLISGTRSNSNRLARIYINNAGANFRNSEMTLPRLTQSSAAWADYDQDGDQDLLFTGFNGTRNRTFLLRSIQSEFQTNEIPIAPTILITDTEIIDGNVFTTFEWNLGSDTKSTVSYNIFIQNANGKFLVSPQANTATGFNRLPQIGNSQRNFLMTFKNLEGGNYDWGVQSIDAALRVSPFNTSNTVIFCPEPQNLTLTEAILENCPTEGRSVNVIMEGSFEVNEVNSTVHLRWGTSSENYTTLNILATDVRLEQNQSSRTDIFKDTVEMSPATTYYYVLEVVNSCGNVQRSPERILKTPVILGDNQIAESQEIERTDTFETLFDIGQLPSHTDPDNLQITWQQSRNAANWDTVANASNLNLQGFAPDSTLYFRRVLLSQNCSDTSNAVLIKIFQPFVHKLDSLLLVEIYNATDGANWTNSWNLSTRVRDWYGVTVEDGRVVELDLNNNGLIGELPDVFDIAKEDNSITSALRYLSFSNNQIIGFIPPTLGELFISLNYLDLSSNDFEGEIPKELGKLIKLETLWLSHNKLEGEVPAEIGNLLVLRTLTVNNNRIVVLAAKLGNLDKLVYFDFSNNLIAVLDDETLTMENLQELIANNCLLKEIPVLFGNCPLLRVVEFEGNRLTSIPESVQNIALLTHLRIGNNLLDFGDIEPLLGKASELFTYSPQADLDLVYDSIVEVGKKVILKVNSQGANNLYQWLLNGEDIQGATNAEYTIFYADQADAGIYNCSVTNSQATDLTLRRRPIRIIISCGNLINALAQTQDALVFCEGDNIYVQFKATQGEGFGYQWYKNGDAIFLANDSNFVATSAGNYSVKINSPEGCGDVSKQVEILQNLAPEVNISSNGATLFFTANVPISRQQWLLNGEAIPNANDSIYEAKQGGKYAVIVTDSLGCRAYSKEIILGITGLEDDEQLLDSQQLTIYPNPTNGLLNIRIPNQLGKVHTLQIHDNLGRNLLTVEIKNQSENYTLDLQNIASGVYWLSILTEKGNFIKKLEKQ